MQETREKKVFEKIIFSSLKKKPITNITGRKILKQNLKILYSLLRTSKNWRFDFPNILVKNAFFLNKALISIFFINRNFVTNN